MSRVLGDPVRWRVVAELRRGTRCACELAEVSGAAPSVLSHHLGVLRDAGVVTAQRRGRWIDYTLASEALDALVQALTDTGIESLAPDPPSPSCAPRRAKAGVS